MPYVIEMNRYLDDPAAEFAPGALPAVQCHAVATLAEARDYLQPIVREAASPRVRSALVLQVASLDRAVGLVGPLPDGTRIRVWCVSDKSLLELARDAGWEAHDNAFVDGRRLSGRGRASAIAAINKRGERGFGGPGG